MLQKLREQIQTNKNNADDVVGLNIMDINGKLVLPIRRIDTNTWVLTIDKKEQVVQFALELNKENVE